MSSTTVHTTTARKRTITPSQWQESNQDYPVKCGSISSIVRQVMAGLLQPPVTVGRQVGSWAPGRGVMFGAMWAGVPCIHHSWPDDEGGWMIATREEGFGLPFSSCLRLLPAEPEDEVQFGFCPAKIDRIEELSIENLGPQEDWKIRKLEINTPHGSQFRIDKMLLAGLRLGIPSNTSVEGIEFRRLLELESISLVSFLSDIARGCYSDTDIWRNILQDRDENYRKALQLVCQEAYPDCLSMPTTFRGLIRLVSSMDKGRAWSGKTYVNPIAYNLVMPRIIFDLVNSNLENEVPIIVPQYVTPNFQLFNDKWSSPCTGFRYNNASVLPEEAKLVAGVISKFNLDVPGRASYWPPNWNPPDAWITKFTDCLRKLEEQTLPLSVSERSDLALATGRQVPVMLRGLEGNEFSRLLDYTMSDPDRDNFPHDFPLLASLTIRECDESGNLHEAESDNLMHCEECGEDALGEYMGLCSNCKGLFCPECIDHSACTTCPSCEARVYTSNLRSCGDCEEPGCEECIEDTHICGTYPMGVRLCGTCRDGHVCPEGE